ncbi:TolB-like translocation protein [Stieleria varia]|uniref:Uncharacterized protein n=1 Tax=Stieleria varia TaxID=2528005 RepID=A0A5C6AG89_9BACT|nr:hypothetical protein [Stieleria varia]TWT98619.1 hypothetical protein Pla52n_51360 [Stieleria varia]
MTKLALLSGGKVYLVDGDRDPTTHESRFAKEAESRVQRSRSTNSWKQETDAWDLNASMMPGLGAFQNAARPQAIPRFTGVTRGIGNTMCYSMNVFGAGGLFSYDLEKGFETRLMHSNDFDPQGLVANAWDGMLAFAVAAGDGTVHIKLKHTDRPHQRQITDGDTCDECPWWHRDDETAFLYFHSTAVGRTPEGYPIGRGPGQICRIAVDEGDVEHLVSDEAYDFLNPRLDHQGALYAIRRPYKPPMQRQSGDLKTTVKDFFLLPYRFMRMLFFFANFMSMMFVGKPLTSEHLVETPETQTQRRVLWGRVLETQKAIQQKGQEKRMRLVPGDWELVRFEPGESFDTGSAKSIAKHVMAYAVADDGAVLYSDGGGVYRLDSAGAETKVADVNAVEQIAVLGA